MQYSVLENIYSALPRQTSLTVVIRYLLDSSHLSILLFYPNTFIWKHCDGNMTLWTSQMLNAPWAEIWKPLSWVLMKLIVSLACSVALGIFSEPKYLCAVPPSLSPLGVSEWVGAESHNSRIVQSKTTANNCWLHHLVLVSGGQPSPFSAMKG